MKLHEVLLTEEEMLLEGLLDRLAPTVKGFIRSLGSTTAKVMIAALLVASPLVAKAASPDEMKAAATVLSQVPDQQWQAVWSNTVDNAASHGLLQQAKISPEKLKTFSKERVVHDLQTVADVVAPARMMSPNMDTEHPGAASMYHTMSGVADVVQKPTTEAAKFKRTYKDIEEPTTGWLPPHVMAVMAKQKSEENKWRASDRVKNLIEEIYDEAVSAYSDVRVFKNYLSGSATVKVKNARVRDKISKGVLELNAWLEREHGIVPRIFGTSVIYRVPYDHFEEEEVVTHAREQARRFFRSQIKAPQNPHVEGTSEHEAWGKAYRASARAHKAAGTREYLRYKRHYDES